MSNFRTRMDNAFGAVGRIVYHNRITALLLSLALLLGLGSQLPRLNFNTDTESFFRQGDPALIAYNQFREQFGRDEMIVIAVESSQVFTREFLVKLRAFHLALETEVPYLREVNSLVNARETRGRGQELVVGNLLETMPETPAEMAALRTRVFESHLYPNLLVSEAGDLVTVVMETQAFSPESAGTDSDPLSGFSTPGAALAATAPSVPEVPQAAPPTPLTTEENAAVIAATRQVMARFQSTEFRVHIAGSPVVNDELKRLMQQDMGKLLFISLVVIGLFLLLLFRRIAGVVLPLLVVLLSVLATVSLLAVVGVPFKLPMMIIPSFLLSVGVGAVMHVLAIFFRHFQEHGDTEAAVVHTFTHSGLPILMTSLTTAAGLLSFASAQMASVAEMGIFAAAGVMIALLLTLVLVPALLSLWPLRRHARFAPRRGVLLVDTLLGNLGEFSVRHARGVVGVTLVVSIVAALGLPQLRFSHNTLAWFPKTMPLRQATELIDQRMKGSLSLEVVVDTGVENGLYDPAVLHGLESFATFAGNYREASGQVLVGKSNSVADVVKEIHQALNENRPEFYALPDTRPLIAQELLLFENSGNDDLRRLVDSQFRVARLTLKVPWKDASEYIGFVETMEAGAKTMFPGSVRVEVTGLMRLFTQTLNAQMHSMAWSYVLAVGIIAVLMILIIGRFRLGLFSMVPNLLPIMITLGMMGWLGIRLDAFTMLIGSIALGLAVDDTIHFFHNYVRAFAKTGSAQQAVRETLLGTGRALLFTSLVLIAGFWVFMFASMNHLYNFGLLTGISLALASIFILVVTPAMMALLTGGDGGKNLLAFNKESQ